MCLSWCCWLISVQEVSELWHFFLPWLWSSRGQRWKVSVWVSTQNLKWNVTNEKKKYTEQNHYFVIGILNWIINSPIDHTRWTSLSEGEASRGVCGRFRIHGGRRERVWPTCRGWRSFTGTARCSVSRSSDWKKDKCQMPHIDNFFFFFLNVHGLN